MSAVETFSETWSAERYLADLRRCTTKQAVALADQVRALEASAGVALPEFWQAYYSWKDETAPQRMAELEASRSAARAIADPAGEAERVDRERAMVEAEMAATAAAEVDLAIEDVVGLADDFGRKFEADDVAADPSLHRFAEAWLRQPVLPDSDWLRQMQAIVVDRGRGLTPGQAKGVLNFAVAAERRRARETEQPTCAGSVGPVAPRLAAAEVTDGMYLVAGDVVKVQIAHHGSGNLYAKVLIPPTETERADGGRARFHYVPGLIRKVRAEDRMSLEQAVEYGRLYGCCIRCGAILTDEDSIEAAMGPICRGKIEEGWS